MSLLDFLPNPLKFGKNMVFMNQQMMASNDRE